MSEEQELRNRFAVQYHAAANGDSCPCCKAVISGPQPTATHHCLNQNKWWKCRDCGKCPLHCRHLEDD